MTHNEVSSAVIGAAIEVHRTLGPGLFESVYQQCMEIELRRRGARIESQRPVRIEYKGEGVEGEAFRADLLVEDAVVVELKSVEAIRPVHEKQLMTYLRLMDKRLGLLINFNEAVLRRGIRRIANGLDDEGDVPPR
jgi:GxxExxY protein